MFDLTDLQFADSSPPITRRQNVGCSNSCPNLLLLRNLWPQRKNPEIYGHCVPTDPQHAMSLHGIPICLWDEMNICQLDDFACRPCSAYSLRIDTWETHSTKFPLAMLYTWRVGPLGKLRWNLRLRLRSSCGHGPSFHVIDRYR